MSFAYTSFSFLQGVLAFFAPCAVALLPGYLAAFVARPDSGTRLARTFKLAGLTIAGIVVVYAPAGVLILALNQLVKSAMTYVATGMGAVFVVLGILMVFGKSLSLNVHVREGATRNEWLEALLFGVAYAIGALGCLFPLFLLVAFNAFAAPPLVGAGYLLAYLAGMSLFMLLFTFLTVYAQSFLQRSLRHIMPYITRVAGGLLIAAGLYIIWYQSALW